MGDLEGTGSANTFWLFVVARLISISGAAATTVAVPLIIYRTSQSALLTGLAAALGGLTYLCVGIPLGLVVDRIPRGTLLIVSSLGRGCLVVSVPLASLAGLSDPTYLLLAVIVGTNVLFVASDAASAASLRSIVGPAAMQRATSTISAWAGVAEVIAPVVAGAMLTLVTPDSLLAAEAGALVISALLYAGIRSRISQRRMDLGSRPHWSDALAGFKFIRSHRVVLLSTVAALIFALIEGLVLGQLVVYSADRFGADITRWWTGLAYTAIGAGSVLGSLLLRRIAFHHRYLAVCALCFAASGALLVVFALSPSPVLSAVALGLWASPFMIVFVGASALRQSEATEDLQGRVAVAGRLSTMAIGVPIGGLLGGVITTASAVSFTILTGAVLALAAALGALYLVVRDRAASNVKRNR